MEIWSVAPKYSMPLPPSGPCWAQYYGKCQRATCYHLSVPDVLEDVSSTSYTNHPIVDHWGASTILGRVPAMEVPNYAFAEPSGIMGPAECGVTTTGSAPCPCHRDGHVT